MIWKRILISFLSVTVPAGCLIAGLVIVQSVSGGGCAGMAFIPHLIFATLAGLFLGGMLSGVLQPPTKRAALDALFFSPGTWFALWMATRPDIHNGFAAGAFMATSMWLIIPVLVSWGGCRLGMKMKTGRMKTEPTSGGDSSTRADAGLEPPQK